MTTSAASLAAPGEAQRLAARETVYRLAAALLGYPLAETQQALEDGRLHDTLNQAWQTLTGQPWPTLEPSASLTELEVGYMATFIHGRRGKPRVPLVANAYEALLAGETPANYMLNVQAYYRHFDLQPALGDEGLTDEPDHLVTMLEFSALLCHLEAKALASNRDASPYRRAQRDFIARHLSPLLHTIKARYASENAHGLDATLTQLIEALPSWADNQRAELEAQVGPCPRPGQGKAAAASASQAMWD